MLIEIKNLKDIMTRTSISDAKAKCTMLEVITNLEKQIKNCKIEEEKFQGLKNLDENQIKKIAKKNNFRSPSYQA